MAISSGFSIAMLNYQRVAVMTQWWPANHCQTMLCASCGDANKALPLPPSTSWSPVLRSIRCPQLIHDRCEKEDLPLSVSMFRNFRSISYCPCNIRGKVVRKLDYSAQTKGSPQVCTTGFPFTNTISHHLLISLSHLWRAACNTPTALRCDVNNLPRCCFSFIISSSISE